MTMNLSKENNMGVGYFYIMIMLIALFALGAIGDLIAVITGYVHPWDFN